MKVANTGLCDVVGGRMWFVSTTDGTAYFWTKSECKQYIKDTFGKGSELLKQLAAQKGRAFCYGM